MTAHICSKEKEWSPAKEISIGVLSVVTSIALGYLGGLFAFESDNVVIVSGYFLAVSTVFRLMFLNGVGAVLHGAGRLVRQ